MSMIILNEEQMDVLRQSIGPVVVCDAHGETLGTVDPDLRHELVTEIQCKTTSDRVTYSSRRVSAMLKYLKQTYAREGNISKDRLNQLIRKFHEQYDGE